MIPPAPEFTGATNELDQQIEGVGPHFLGSRGDIHVDVRHVDRHQPQPRFAEMAQAAQRRSVKFGRPEMAGKEHQLDPAIALVGQPRDGIGGTAVENIGIGIHAETSGCVGHACLPLPRQMAAGDVAECQRRPQRDAGPRIISVHDRPHVVAAGIETGDRHTIRVQHPRIGIGSKADGGAKVRRIDPKRIKRRALDRGDAGIGRMAGVAEVALIDRRAASEFKITPHPRIRIVIVNRQGQHRFFDADGIGKRTEIRASISSPLLTYRPMCQRKRLDTTKPVAPEKLAVADQVEWTTRGVIAVRQHGADKLVIGQCFIDEIAFPTR